MWRVPGLPDHDTSIYSVIAIFMLKHGACSKRICLKEDFLNRPVTFAVSLAWTKGDIRARDRLLIIFVTWSYNCSFSHFQEFSESSIVNIILI